MGHTGYIDWHHLLHARPWTAVDDGRHTYVCAFWLVDYGRSDKDQGVTLFKREGAHPDWFVYADRADHMLAAYCHPNTIVSPNFGEVFDNKLSARPLLASMVLGTSSVHFKSFDGRHSWWCTPIDLTRAGRKLVKTVSKLYLREPVIVTFVNDPSDGNGGPRDPQI